LDQIIINELEVFARVGVPEAERASPQKLLITLIMDHDFSKAALKDDLGATVDYYAVSIKVLEFAKERDWKLIETLAVDLAHLILRDFKPQRVSVQIKKFIVPQARFVAVQIERTL
jgi:dihydroneopterin aldolase